MGRAKQKMELIANEKTRNLTYRKRKLGTIKKAKELGILCDVGVVMIMYPPNCNEPEIWPENADQVENAIRSYKRKKSESSIKTYGLSDFFEDRKKRIEDELVKARKKNIEAKYPTWFEELDGLNEGQLRQFAIELKYKENIVRANLDAKKSNILMQQWLTGLEPSSVGGGSQSYPSLDQVQTVNVNHLNHNVMNHEIGWCHEPMNQKPDVYSPYQGSEFGMVYNNLNALPFQQPMVQYDPMQQFAEQEVEAQVNSAEYGAFLDFGMNEYDEEYAIQNENLGMFCYPCDYGPK